MIQWYPGHMAKAKRILKEDLKLVDLVVELLDARIPASSRNPELDELLSRQERIVALNKIDLADSGLNQAWKGYFRREYPVVLVNALRGRGTRELLAFILEKAEIINRSIQARGRQSRDIRVLVLGIPNVGKSALINTMAGNGATRTGNKPGVTRGRQWITIGDEIQLLDTPGILWPKFADEDTGYKLALTGAISDDIYDEELAAYKLISFLLEINPDILEEGYQIQIDTDQPYDILAEIGRKRGCLMSGGRVNRDRASNTLISDFRKGKLGPVTLERPKTGAAE